MTITKDPWVGCDWEVYDVQGDGGPELGPGRFRLISNGGGGYTVQSLNMPNHWATLVFLPHGANGPKQLQLAPIGPVNLEQDGTGHGGHE